jgi:hypothetical protein
VEELGGALCRYRWGEVFKCAMASSEAVLLVSREVRGSMAADHGWLARLWVKLGRGLGAFGSWKNSKCCNY